MTHNDDDLDQDGYPTIEVINEIRNWTNEHYDFVPLFERLRSLWYYPDYFSSHEENQITMVYEISTGGWSGNEDLIAALSQNIVAWSVCWYSSRRGGHYCFHVPKTSSR